MKLPFFFLGLIFFLFSCGSSVKDVTNPEGPTPVKLLVLMDKSTSIKFTKGQLENLPQNLNDLIAKSVGNNSTLGIYFINSVAMSKAHYNATIRLKEPDLNVGGQDREMAMDQFDNQLRSARNNWRKRIKEALVLKPAGITANETDLWGCLSGVEKFFKGQRSKVLYIYSDMVHSTKGLDHHKSPPKDLKAARAQAKKEIPGMMAEHNLKTTSLAGTSIKVIFPGNAVSTNKNKIMEAYWNTVFEGLGAQDITFE